ncbi:hypothetical protein FO014_10930 [Serratia rhizosphaerae]|uniref:Uncharacterized protein n=2 Tax=Serratia rhizosphaerae TaxID=2597702 RepID=A0ABX6GMC6_9GAMM|nr:hypothetical protein FO014_10930 [Serratia rhizosphaerae]
MERQIAARDPAVFADIEPELEQLFLTPGQRLAPPGIGNTMGLMMALASGVAGVMGLMADMAFALTDVSPAAALLGSGAILAVWMTLILLQLTQGKNSGVLLLKYDLLLLPVALLAALFAWGMGVSGFFSVVLLLAGTAGGFIFSHRTIFYLYVAYFRSRRRVFVKRRWQMAEIRRGR